MESQLVQFAIAGLTTGSVYAIVALGYNIVFNTTGLINFAHGQFVVLGALIAISLTSSLKLPAGLAFLLAVVLMALVGLVFERLLARRPLRKASHLVVVLVTLSAGMLISGLAMVIWGKLPLALQSFSGEKAIPFIWGTSISRQALWVMGVTLLTALLLASFLRYTRMGKAMRAVADNRMGAVLMGVNAQTLVVISFGLSAAVAAVAGILIAPITFMAYDDGAMLSIKGIMAAIFGGMGSYLGAMVGGLLLGLLEVFSAGLTESAWKEPISLVALVIILLVRPNGILGKRLE